MKLYIDTSSNQKTIVKLDSQILEKNSSTWHSQMVLPMIEELLKKSNKSLKDITKIEVNTGPGSFTGLRVGVSIANTIGYCLGIPVNGKRPDKLEIAEPEYS